MSEPIKRCVECEHFKVIKNPRLFSWGKGVCTPNGLRIEFKNKKALDKIKCPIAEAYEKAIRGL